MGLGHSPRIVTDGLVLCLDAANKRSYGGSGTTWTDRSTSGNDGTLINEPGFNASGGGSIGFSNTNDYVDLGNPATNFFSSIAGTDQVTIAGWIKTSASVTSQQIIFDSGNSENLQMDIYQNGIAFLTRCPTNIRISRYTIDVDKWYYFVGTYNGSKMIGYINGEKYTESSRSGNLSSDTQYSAFGKQPGSTYYFRGRISQFKAYNRALTADEIRQNYLATKERYA